MEHIHVGTWNYDSGNAFFRADIWDTNRTDELGKGILRYALAIIPNGDSRPVIFDGEDFHLSPLHTPDEDDTAASLIGFFSHYGESIRYAERNGYEADVPEDLTARQREALATYAEALSLWSLELDGTLS